MLIFDLANQDAIKAWYLALKSQPGTNKSYRRCDGRVPLGMLVTLKKTVQQRDHILLRVIFLDKSGNFRQAFRTVYFHAHRKPRMRSTTISRWSKPTGSIHIRRYHLLPLRRVVKFPVPCQSLPSSIKKISSAVKTTASTFARKRLSAAPFGWCELISCSDLPAQGTKQWGHLAFGPPFQLLLHLSRML